MDIETLFTHPKWKIFVELSKAPASPQQLSEKLRTSIANVSQQLKLLEAMQFVKRQSVSNNGKGKPKALYSIKEDFSYLISLNNLGATKQYVKLNPANDFFIKTMLNFSQKDHEIMQKYFWDNYDILSQSSIGILKNDENQIELVILNEDIETVRKKLKNKDITIGEKTKKIIIWSHNTFEIENGLKAKEAHFLNLMNNTKILVDGSGNLEKFQNTVKG